MILRKAVLQNAGRSVIELFLFKKKPFPAIFILLSTIFPVTILEHLLVLFNWKFVRSGSTVSVAHKGDVLVMDVYHANLLAGEYEGIWKAFYTVEGRENAPSVIIDAGAGEGETCHFYFQHGVQKIIAIESDPQCVGLLQTNVQRNKWNVEIVASPFKLEHLKEFPCDLLKLDIEGSESILLQMKTLPCRIIMEAHSIDLARKFESRFGMKVVHASRDKRCFLLHSRVENILGDSKLVENTHSAQ